MRQIAVLFDAENIAANWARPVLSQLASLGQVSTAKAIGDFTDAKLSAWKGEANQLGLMLVLQPSLGKGKNSADIRLVIEAMDLAHRGQVNTIALVSNDRDFTPLALHLRDLGLYVHGFGTGKAPQAFQTACTLFTSLPEEDCAAPAAVVAGAIASVPPQPAKPAPAAKNGSASAVSVARLAKLSPDELQELTTLIQTLSEAASGPADLAQIGSRLAQANPRLFKQLSAGKGLLHRLLSHGIVEQVGAKPIKVRLPLRIAG